MTETYNLKAVERTDLGRHASREMRRNKMIPVEYYGFERGNRHLAVTLADYLKFRHSGHRVLHLNVDDSDLGECIIREVQQDPVSEEILHLDLFALHPEQKVTLKLPVEFLGTPEGVKEGGTFQRLQFRLKIRCLPKDIPDRIRIDVSHLKSDEMLLVRDLQLENLEIREPGSTPVAKVKKPRVTT